MEGEEGGDIRLSKRFSYNKGGGEVDYKTTSTRSHGTLSLTQTNGASGLPNKPTPSTNPVLRRLLVRQVAFLLPLPPNSITLPLQYAQEEEFYHQTALISKKDMEKVELMQAVCFMYVRPPGYNAESTKAAEMIDQTKRAEMINKPQQTNYGGPSSSLLETGIAARVKPFGVEVRNVKCFKMWELWSPKW